MHFHPTFSYSLKLLQQWSDRNGACWTSTYGWRIPDKPTCDSVCFHWNLDTYVIELFVPPGPRCIDKTIVSLTVIYRKYKIYCNLYVGYLLSSTLLHFNFKKSMVVTIVCRDTIVWRDTIVLCNRTQVHKYVEMWKPEFSKINRKRETLLCTWALTRTLIQWNLI